MSPSNEQQASSENKDTNQIRYCYPIKPGSESAIDWETFQLEAKQPGTMETMTWSQRYMVAFFDFLAMEARAIHAERRLAEMSKPIGQVIAEQKSTQKTAARAVRVYRNPAFEELPQLGSFVRFRRAA